MSRSWTTYRIIQEEHNRREPPCPSFVEENHLPHIADISNLRMTEAELPYEEGRVLHEKGNDDCQYQAIKKSQSVS